MFECEVPWNKYEVEEIKEKLLIDKISLEPRMNTMPPLYSSIAKIGLSLDPYDRDITFEELFRWLHGNPNQPVPDPARYGKDDSPVKMMFKDVPKPAFSSPATMNEYEKRAHPDIDEADALKPSHSTVDENHHAHYSVEEYTEKHEMATSTSNLKSPSSCGIGNFSYLEVESPAKNVPGVKPASHHHQAGANKSCGQLTTAGSLFALYNQDTKLQDLSKLTIGTMSSASLPRTTVKEFSRMEKRDADPKWFAGQGSVKNLVHLFQNPTDEEIEENLAPPEPTIMDLKKKIKYDFLDFTDTVVQQKEFSELGKESLQNGCPSPEKVANGMDSTCDPQKKASIDVLAGSKSMSATSQNSQSEQSALLDEILSEILRPANIHPKKQQPHKSRTNTYPQRKTYTTKKNYAFDDETSSESECEQAAERVDSQQDNVTSSASNVTSNKEEDVGEFREESQEPIKEDSAVGKGFTMTLTVESSLTNIGEHRMLHTTTDHTTGETHVVHDEVVHAKTVSSTVEI